MIERRFEQKFLILPNTIGNKMLFNVILKEAEDGWIVAECPALPGCVSQGKDNQEAIDNIKEAITAWLWAENQKAFLKSPPNHQQQAIMVSI